MYRPPSQLVLQSLSVGRKRSKSADDDELTTKRRPHHQTPESAGEVDKENQYIHIEIIKWGSFGVVSRVKPKDNPTQVYAQKQLDLRSSGLKVVRNEVNLIRKVRHRHIVQVIDAFADKASDNYFIILHPSADSDLRKYLDDTAALSHRRDALQFGLRRVQLLAWMSCLAGALYYIHSHDVRHRDIKPENILIYGTNILFTDFGTSYHSDKNTRYTVTETPSTEKYAPPEASGKRRFGRKGDVFALGCVVFEMLDAISGPLLLAKRLPRIMNETYASANIHEVLVRDRDEIREHNREKRHLEHHHRLSTDFPRSLLLLISDMLDPVPESRCNSEEAVQDFNEVLRESNLNPMSCCTTELQDAKSQKHRLLRLVMGRNAPKQLIIVTTPGNISKFISNLALAEKGNITTVVITPTAIPPIHILQRLQNCQISYLWWESWEKKVEPYVFVPAEAACTDSFLEYMKGLQDTNASLRILVNDCDPFLAVGNCTLSSQITQIESPSQTIWLATAASKRWIEQISQTCFRHAPTLVREETRRENMKYSVESCNSWRELEERAAQLIESCFDVASDACRRNEDNDDRVLLYCATESCMNSLAARLRSPHKHVANSGLLSRLHRDRVIAAWSDPTTSPVLLVTGTEDFGFDYPHVRRVIHVGEPSSMEALSRESGRAGRDGKVAESIVLLGPTEQPAPSGLVFRHDLSDEKVKELYLSRKYCLRALISKFEDEHSSCTQCMLDDELCSVCELFEAR